MIWFGNFASSDVNSSLKTVTFYVYGFYETKAPLDIASYANGSNQLLLLGSYYHQP